MTISSKLARARRRREYLTADEIDRLLASSKTTSRNPERDYAILLLAYRHELRLSELFTRRQLRIEKNWRGLLGNNGLSEKQED